MNTITGCSSIHNCGRNTNIFDNFSINLSYQIISHAAPQSDKQWGVLFLIVGVITGILGNVLVCIAVTMERKLQNVTNYFLLSLAVADLLVSIIVMPIAMVNEYMGKLTATIIEIIVSNLQFFQIT